LSTFFLTRLWHGLIVVCGVTAIVFIVTRIVGDPVSVMLPIDASDAERALMAQQLGLDQPIHVQFMRFIADMASFNFGDSLWQRRPALDIVAERLPMTALLSFTSVCVAVLIAAPLGIMAAMRPGGWVDNASTVGGIAGLSIPQFWLGLLLIIAFGVQLKWLPTSGSQGALAIVLPAATLAVRSIARLSAVVRSSMLDELSRAYVRTARAKGLSVPRIVLHALRNAAVPLVTLAGWEFVSTLAGGVIVVETIFAWPGLGLTIVQAIERQDLVLLQAAVFTTAIVAVGVNLAVDLVHRLIDPRIALN
jgi:peptide/nickel transport system permease protein